MKKQISENGVLELKPPKDKKESVRILQDIVPRMNIREDDIEFVVNIDSTEIKPSHWDSMIEIIAKNMTNMTVLSLLMVQIQWHILLLR
jgi:L-asparaginase/Glu-tRNA(Gln) amidotransferase subunit D